MNKIYIKSEKRGLGVPAEVTAVVKNALKRTLNDAALGLDCEAYILYTDDDGIRALNREHRQLDKPTDVLSFPMWELTPGQGLPPETAEPDTGRAALGDIVISVPTARAQAEAYGHGFAREMAFLALHGLLHLLGYDHETPEDEARMRAKQEEILSREGLGR